MKTLHVYVQGKEALVKSSCSIDFVVENREFTGADSYTLSIVFPMADSPTNREIFGWINRKDVISGVKFVDCEIHSGKLSINGALAITGITESEVTGQFLSGKSASNYYDTLDNVYINTLDLGSPSYGTLTSMGISTSKIGSVSYIDGEPAYVLWPWVNDYSGNIQNGLETEEEKGKYQGWNEVSYKNGLSFQPFFVYIFKRICKEIGFEFSGDFGEWSRLVICNTLPSAWRMHEFKDALPRWTVTEFFEQVELLTGCEIDIDYSAKRIKLSWSERNAISAGTVVINETFDDYSTSVDVAEDPSSKYRGACVVKYEERDDELWPFESCREFIEDYGNEATIFATYKEMTEALSKYDGRREISNSEHFLYYCDETKAFYCLRANYWEQKHLEGVDGWYYYYYFKPQPLNLYGERYPLTDKAGEETIKIVPARVDYTDKLQGYMFYMDCGELDNNDSVEGYYYESGGAVTAPEDPGKRPTENTYDDGNSVGTGRADRTVGGTPWPAAILKNYGDESQNEYLDKLYVGFWSSERTTYPLGDIAQDPTAEIFQTEGFKPSLRLTSDFRGRTRQIDVRQKTTFKFLSSEIPNVRASYIINGQKYICEKLTVSISPETGVSELITGVFYPIV